jgi:hypothetical protein
VRPFEAFCDFIGGPPCAGETKQIRRHENIETTLAQPLLTTRASAVGRKQIGGHDP